MIVDVKLFAILRERAGRDRVGIELGEGATVADALAALGNEPGLDEVLGRLPVDDGRQSRLRRGRRRGWPRATSWR